MNGVLVIAEQWGGALASVTWEAIAAALELPGPITAVIPGSGCDQAARELGTAPLAGVTLLEHDELRVYTADAYVEALSAFVTGTAPAYVLFPHTYRTRDFAPKLAARLDRPLVTDCVGLKPFAERLAFTRPMFQGKVRAEVVMEGPPPHLLTVQLGAFQADAVPRGAMRASTRVPAHVSASLVRERPEAPFREARQAVDLTRSERIVAVGRGVGSREHVAVVERLAAAFGAEVAASRPVCDAGWLSIDRQVGSSGQTVAPVLYVAVGISGAIQHILGMRGARTIVAINKDPEAPIFEIADYGIVGDLFEIVPALIAALNA